MATPKVAETQFRIEFETDGDMNESLTTHFSTMRIINSTRAIWPIFQLYFHVDNQTFIEKNIYGKSTITCKIYATHEDGTKSEPIEYKLLYIECNLDLPPKEEKNRTIDDQQEVQRRHAMVSCVSLPAYQSMTTFVNKLYEEEEDHLRPIDYVKDLLDQNGIKYIIKEDGCNKDLINQMIIPPMTMRNAVDYINQNYGIYSGPMFRYCNYSGEFLMWDLKKMYEQHKDSPWVKMHKSPSHFDTPGKFKEINEIAASTENEFVTHKLAESINHGNANMLRYGYDNIYIYHPSSDIAVFQKKNADDIITDYGIWHNKNEMKYHPELKTRKLYFSDMRGFENEDYTGKYNTDMLTQNMASAYQNAAAVRITLLRNVKVPLASKVGEVLYLKPYSDFEKFQGSNYEGGYLISDSEIVFTREESGSQEQNVTCIATLTAHRTSQSKD